MSPMDANARYIPAIGTRTKPHSAFGKYLEKLGIRFSQTMTVESMVNHGWIVPRRRIVLPRDALDAWSNYPSYPAVGEDDCPEAHRWAYAIHDRATSGPLPTQRDRWWLHEFDDDQCEVSAVAKEHAADPGAAAPEPFTHAKTNRQVRPWIDYFAYWQAFQIVEYQTCMTAPFELTSELPEDRRLAHQQYAKWVDGKHQRLQKRWSERELAFDWISRMRTAIGSCASVRQSVEDLDTVVLRVAEEQGLELDRMRQDVRSTLLVMWSQLTGKHSQLLNTQRPLLELLRQDIQYAHHCIEIISGEHEDILSEFWSPMARRDPSPKLTDALPYESDLARRDFAVNAAAYRPAPRVPDIDNQAVRRLIDKNWHHNAALQRFVIAFHRLHEQLSGEQLTADDRVIRRTERIEQFNLLVMHAERVMSHEARRRNPDGRYQDLRPLVKSQLNHVLGCWDKSKFFSIAQRKLKHFLIEKAQLHDLDPDTGLLLMNADDVQTGDRDTDQLIASLVNVVIARNYAAHHDALDFELVYPVSKEGQRHAGGHILESVLVVVLATLNTNGQGVAD